jgi:hypothetical protein
MTIGGRAVTVITCSTLSCMANPPPAIVRRARRQAKSILVIVSISCRDELSS